mmetsp:Transcript_14568/g.19921  ORF Transcript_14568/g.19921 Transcript_14568/m.19921 type:complete len:266 (-) Transcript_14568:1102-1899(-)|eukprot:CAMPEP_0185723490 /NCGR_PEP_ID=MMETSP1171-20130828/315_1 /TAXON_ID=374046 /ORGANISM="Helicotheca tamensis, Strain CCMP826" /LENGTH=265 /DNA_ID=CAMNT_0028391203 /DNA_START=26 /DNA_END=823 /DNA_ORIENTATION=+
MVNQYLSIVGFETAPSCDSINNFNIFYNASEECGMSNATSATLSELGNFVSEWFFESRTNFYGMHDELVLPWWFGLCCLNYSIGGAFGLITRPKWARRSNFPFTAIAFFLVFFQGPLSFLADYMNMTNDSIWHTLDRCVAVPLFLCELIKIWLMIPHTRRGVMTTYTSSTAIALLSFMMSQRSQKELNTDGFVFWHNMWHMYPIVCSIIMSVDKFVLDEYDPQAAASKYDQKNKSDHPLLSTVVMNDPKYQTRKRIRTRKTRKES